MTELERYKKLLESWRKRDAERFWQINSPWLEMDYKQYIASAIFPNSRGEIMHEEGFGSTELRAVKNLFKELTREIGEQWWKS